jgi:hypothetical protein
MSGCDLCGAPKAIKTCGPCEREVCKNCVAYLAPDQFRFHPAPPEFSKFGVFCIDCFENEVRAEVERYNEALERSEKVKIVRSSYHGYIPCLRKAERDTEVKDDAGRGIAVWRLKFLCAWEGFDTVIHLDTKHKKVRNEGWETKSWSASGLFVDLDHKKFRPPEESD